MIPQPPIPEALWNTVPPEAQAAILAVFDSLQGRIAELEQRIGDLEARLKLNSTNSSKPPSSDPIGFKRKPPAPPSGRKRGGQPGHPRVQSRLVPEEKVRTITECRPTDCRRCGHALGGDDPTPLVHQVAELPKIEPLVDEYRLHRLACPQCGTTTCGTLPEGVPQGCFGPYLQAVLATLAGGYRLSKRQVQQMAGDLFGLPIATGMVSKLERQSATVLDAPYHEVAVAVHDAKAAGIDDTSWRENRRKAQLSVVVTALTTVFTIVAKRSAAVAQALLGSKPSQVVTSDRQSSFEWIDPAWRQICWSHSERDFQAMIDRGGAGEATGRVLLRLAKRMFRWWHRVRDGTIDRARFQTIAARLRHEVKAALKAGQSCGCVKTAATCFEILKVEVGLWTFVRVEGVGPTNNGPERALRHAVIWRRISGGTDSTDGSRFVERMLTVVATCRQQKRNVLDYLSACFEAHLRGQKVPSLLPGTDRRSK
jgi:transposase